MIYRIAINFVLLSAEIQLQQALRSDGQYRNRLEHVVDLMDVSKDGTISRDELLAFLGHIDVRLMLRSLDLNLTALDVNELVDMLDAGGSRVC